ELDEEGADAVADAARTAVQHDPDTVVLVETDLDEVVARAESAEVPDVPSAVELRMACDDALVSGLQPLPCGLRFGRDAVAPRTTVVATAAVGAPVRHGALDPGADVGEVVRQVAAVQGGAHRHHPAPDVDTDR